MRQDTLLKKLATQRDFVVHRGMLELQSVGYAGTTRGKNLKMGLGFDVAPTESSDEGFLRFARGLKGHRELQQMLGLGDEDLRPCIQP